MTILHAVRWIIGTWKYEVKQATTANCFKKALNMVEDTPATNDTEPPQHPESDICDALRKLQDAKRIEKAMDINSIIDPPGEGVHDAWNDATVDESILRNFRPRNVEEGVLEEAEEHHAPEAPPKPVTENEALNALEVACRFQEQQEHCDVRLLRAMEDCMERIKRSIEESLRQSSLHNYFGHPESSYSYGRRT